MTKSRVIALVDMDCFYCQVEERDDPSLKGVPAAVVQYKAFQGGGIIAVNYEARAKGVSRYMRGDDAKAACPEIMLVRVPEVNGKADLTRYRDAGKEVVDVLCEFSNNVERASVDEAYIDLTEAINSFISEHTKKGDDLITCLSTIDMSSLEGNFPFGFETSDAWIESLRSSEMLSMEDVKLALGAEIVGRMRKAVYEKTGFRCSAGIAHNKVLAKLGAGLNKPNKQTVITHSAVPGLYEKTKVTKVRSLGGQFGEHLVTKLKCEFMSDLLQYSLKQLQQYFGDDRGEWLYQLARGHDNESVTNRQLAQSIGCSKNFFGQEALTTKEMATFWVNRLCTEVYERIQRDLETNNRRAKLLTLHITFQDQKGLSRSCGKNVPYNIDRLNSSVIATMERLYQQFGVLPIVQLGLIASKLEVESKNNQKIDSFFGVKPKRVLAETSKKNKPKDDDICNNLIVSEKPKIIEEKEEDSDVEIVDEVSIINPDVTDKEIEHVGRNSNVEATPEKVNVNDDGNSKSVEKRKPFFVCSTSPLKSKKLVLPQNKEAETSPPSLPKSTNVPDDTTSKSVKVSTNEIKRSSNDEIKAAIPIENNPDNEDGAVPCCSKYLIQEKSTTPPSEKSTVEKPSQAGTRTLSREYLQVCERCGEDIPLWDYASHLDFHVAMDLQEVFNQNSVNVSDSANNNNSDLAPDANSSEKTSGNKRGASSSSSTGGRGRGGASKRGRSTTTLKPAQMKTLDSYFLPKI